MQLSTKRAVSGIAAICYRVPAPPRRLTVIVTPISAAARFALPALLLGAVGIAFAPIFVRLSEVGPISTAFYRILLALPALWLWMHLEERHDRRAAVILRKPKGWRDHVVMSLPGLFFAGDLAFWHLSISLTSVANATLLANFAPVFVTIFGWLLFRLKVSGTFILGMMLALGGAIVLMAESLTISSAQVLGDGLGIITAGFYAAYILAVNRLRATYSTATIMAWSAVSNTIVLFAVTLLVGESFLVPSLTGWLILLGLALISHAGGQSLIAYALAHLPPAFGSVSLLLQPAVAALLAWAILDERLSIWQGVGGLVILFGIFLARRGSRTKRSATSQAGSSVR